MDDIKKLRERSGAGMADCKKALEEANGDMEGAIEILRKKGAATATKRADKSANEGVIATAVADDHKSGAIVEVNCETDFVARNEQFSAFAESLAQVVLQNNPANEEEMLNASIGDMTVQQTLNELLAKFSERIEVRRTARVETTDGYITAYVHSGSRLAVLVELENGGENAEQLGRDVAMQVAAMNPLHVRREEVAEALVEKEKNIYREQLAAENKPAEIIEKIITGRVEKFFAENVLLEQSFVKDSAMSVTDVLKGYGPDTTVRAFVRFNLGEELQESVPAENA